jgi:hypothetical protein
METKRNRKRCDTEDIQWYNITYKKSNTLLTLLIIWYVNAYIEEISASTPTSTNRYHNNFNYKTDSDREKISTEHETKQQKSFRLLPTIHFKQSQNQHLQLDFSGRICTHVIGPTRVIDDPIAMNDDVVVSTFGQQPPLIPIYQDYYQNEWYHPFLPSIYVATDYDFTKNWYGINKLGITALFRARTQKTSTMTRSSSYYLTLTNTNKQKLINVKSKVEALCGRATSLLCPTWIHVTKEYPIDSSNSAKRQNMDTSCTIIGCQWPISRRSQSLSTEISPISSIEDDYNNKNMNLISFQCCTQDHSLSKWFQSLILRIPLHKRIQVEYRLLNDSILLQNDSNRNTKHSTDSSTKDTTEDWWIPKVQVDALGLMESKNQLWFDKECFGLTLSIRRKLNWSALGWLGGANDNDYNYTDDSSDAEQTRIRFRIKHYSSPRVSSSLELSSQLVRPFQSAKILLRRDSAIGL